jgi:origin recognition complex subunit 5
VPHLHFPPYTKLEAIKILALDVPSIDPTPSPHTSLLSSAETTNPSLSSPKSPSFSRLSESETKDLYTRYLSAIWDTFAKHSGRDVVSFHALSLRLWHDFTRPIREEPMWSSKDFPKLLVRQRSLLRGEGIMIPKIVDTGSAFARFDSVGVKSSAGASASPITVSRQPAAVRTTTPQTLALARPSKTPPLPHTSLVLLIAAYLASHTPARHDSSLFSKSSALAKKRRKGGVAKPRKEKPGTGRGRRINRQLLGPQAWVVERVLSIFWALLGEANPVRRPGSGVGGFGGGGVTRGIGSGEGMKSGSADVLGALATLASLRLVVKTSKVADVLDASTKFRVNVGWEVIRGVGRAVGVEVEDYVLD